MKFPVKNFGLILAFGLPVMFPAHADEIFRPSHGGDVVKKSGLSYEVVRKPKEILVYPPKDDAPAPKEVKMKFKDKAGNINELRLALTPPKNPGTNIYTAPLPQSILIAGGVSFDLGISDKAKREKEK